MSKADKLRETFSGSKSDSLRIWTIDFLEQINTAVGGGGGGGGLATESTLISVLNAVVSTQQDVEILLVRDTGNGNLVVQQITDYSGGAPVVTYKDVNGVVYVPVGPLEYLDPSAVQNLILVELITMATPVTAVSTTLDIITGAGAASVAAGKRSVSFMASGDADTEVDGATLKSGLSITYPLLSDRDTYDTIPYNALTGELTITTIG
jgi:hypothetical protein